MKVKKCNVGMACIYNIASLACLLITHTNNKLSGTDYSRIVLIIGDLNGLGHLPEFAKQILNRKRGSCTDLYTWMAGSAEKVS